jgi:histidinol-phosphate aminotransferase
VVIDALNRVRGPFNINAPGLAAAEAAILDQDFANHSISFNAHWLTWLTHEIRALGLEVTPSVGNFILVKFPSEPGKNAEAGDAYLRSRGVIVRAVRAYGLDAYLRISIGLEEPNRLTVAALKDFMAL